jgi:membrane fusion protein (multidrug efflux system)
MRKTTAILLAVLLSPWAASLAQPGPMAMPVKVAPVIQDTVTAEITALGTLRADESIMVRPEIAGRVQTIHFQEGQAVAKNDPLITLDPAE